MNEEFLLKQIAQLQEKFAALEAKQNLASLRAKQERDLWAIRMKTIFAGLGEPIPHEQGEGDYPFGMYRDSGRKTKEEKWPNGEVKQVAGQPIVDYTQALSDEHKAELLAQGWTENHNGIPTPERALAGAKR